MSDPACATGSEQWVLGALLLSGRKAIDAVTATGLDGVDFYHPRHEMIYTAILGLDAAGKPTDPQAVINRLVSTGDAGRCGGAGYLHDCIAACDTPVTADHHARIILDHSTRRGLQAAGAAIAALGGPGQGEDVGALVEAAHAALQGVSGRVHGRASATTDDTFDDLLEDIENGASPATPTHIADLDAMLDGGLRAGTLNVVGARPGIGKTVLGTELARRTALHGGRAGYTSLEMTAKDLLTRILSAQSEISYKEIVTSSGRPLGDASWKRIRTAREIFRDTGLHISDTAKTGVTKIRSDIHRMIRTRGACDLWVIDYLQLVQASDTKVIREQQVAAITRDLKQLALETGTPIVLLAQLNREGSRSGGRPPIITDLRESGAIEQDADTVILLHRDVEESPYELNVNIAKNRRGRPGLVEVTFDGRCQRIYTATEWRHGRNG